MRQAVLYARFSPKPIKLGGKDPESCEIQLELMRAYCVASQWEVLSEHQDEAKSGATIEGRPGLETAISEACKAKAVLVAYRLDRLARNVRDLLDVAAQLEAAGTHFASITERIDTTSPWGECIYTIMGAIAVLERKQTSERTKHAYQARKAAGKIQTQWVANQQLFGRGTVVNGLPFGYRLREGSPADKKVDASFLEPDPDEWPLREKMTAWHKSGMTITQIHRRLTKLGIKRRGGPWCWHQVAKVCDFKLKKPEPDNFRMEVG